MRDEDFQYQRKEEDLIICEYWAQNGRCSTAEDDPASLAIALIRSKRSYRRQ
jgi:hypothetical protein